MLSQPLMTVDIVYSNVAHRVIYICPYFFRRDRRERAESRPKKKRIYMENGFHPPPPIHYEKRHPYKSNGYISQKPPPIAPVFMTPLPAPPPQPRPVSMPMTSRPAHYATYHGQPTEMRSYAPHQQNGTMSGPPPIVIPYGTVAVRPDPRPVVHKSHRKRESDTSEGRRKSPKHRSPNRQQSQNQEFVIQQSHDGIPVIRPVIYVDDDDTNLKKHRSKSREGRYKKRSTEQSPAGPRIT